MGGWQSIPASRLNASNADTWRGARHASNYCSARCAMRARSERYRQQMAAGALENGVTYRPGSGCKNVRVPSRVNQGAWRRANPYNLDTAQRS